MKPRHLAGLSGAGRLGRVTATENHAAEPHNSVLPRRAAVSGGLAALAVGIGAPAAEAGPRSDMNELADISAIRDVLDGIDAAVDAKDWKRCRAYFTDQVHVDFAALEGGPPARIPADDLVAAWRRNLFAEKASFHSRSNHQIVVDGQRAKALSKGYAFNRLDRALGDNLWEVWAEYSHELVRTPGGWRCSAIGIVKVLHARGNEVVRTYQPSGD